MSSLSTQWWELVSAEQSQWRELVSNVYSKVGTDRKLLLTLRALKSNHAANAVFHR